MSDFTPWPSIEKVWNVQKTARKAGVKLVSYRAKVKLHGTHAAVRVPALGGGEVVAQSRNNSLNIENDNFGFAAWTAKQHWPRYAFPYVAFGEWVGPGVQTGVALADIPERVFVVYSADVGEHLTVRGPADILVDPDTLRELLPKHHVLPWFGPEFFLDFETDNTSVMDNLNQLVDCIDGECPWTKTNFGVSGHGEGLVCYPIGRRFADYAFKVKGESHAKGGKAPAKMKPPVSDDAKALAASMATEARCLQFFVPGSTVKDVGPFLGAVCKDVVKECQAEMAASNIEWKTVNPLVVKLAREWFLAKIA